MRDKPFITPEIVLSNHGDYQFRDESFEMDANYEIKEDNVIIALSGSALLTEANIMTVVMRPGVGKSSLCEAICAGGINPDADSFGFEINLYGRNALFLDTERTKHHLGKGYRNIVRRAQAIHEPGVMENGKLCKLRVYSYRVLDSAEKYLKHLEGHLKSGDFALVILDQAADFLKSINNEAEAMQFVKKLEYLGAYYRCGFLVTIHPNPMDKTYKPNGWIGSYLLKKSETVMAGFKAENGVRVLTTEFEHGKVRGAYDVVETAFKWSQTDHMHMSVEVTGKIKESVKKYEFIDKVIGELFDVSPTSTGKNNYTPEELVIALKAKLAKKHQAVIDEDFLKTYCAEMGVIQKFGGIYYLRKHEEDDKAPF